MESISRCYGTSTRYGKDWHLYGNSRDGILLVNHFNGQEVGGLGEKGRAALAFIRYMTVCGVQVYSRLGVKDWHRVSEKPGSWLAMRQEMFDAGEGGIV